MHIEMVIAPITTNSTAYQFHYVHCTCMYIKLVTVHVVKIIGHDFNNKACCESMPVNLY